MSDRRYASDYRIEEHVAPDGSLQSRRIYQGKYYRFRRREGEIRALGWMVLGCAALAFVCLLPLLMNNTNIGRTVYVVLPVAFALLPLYHITAVGFRLLRYTQPLTRQQRDLTRGRLRTATAWLLVLLGAGSVGCCVYALRGGVERGEPLCVAGIFLGTLVCLVLLPLRGRAEVTEVQG